MHIYILPVVFICLKAQIWVWMPGNEIQHQGKVSDAWGAKFIQAPLHSLVRSLGLAQPPSSCGRSRENEGTCQACCRFEFGNMRFYSNLGARLSDIPTETGLINEFWLRWFWHRPLKLWSQFSTKYEAVCLSAWPHACSSLVVTDVPRVASCTTVTGKHFHHDV